MNLKKGLDDLFKVLSNDEILLRLLHYIPEDASDKPLDNTKPDVLSLKNKWEIIDKVLMPTDKKYDLDLESKICRLCFYTGTRQPLQNYNQTSRSLSDNPYASSQNYNFDIYVHVDIDHIDGRLTNIADRLNEILLLERVADVGEFVLDFGSPINTTPDGLIGYKLVYNTVSLQESKVRSWGV